MCRALLLVMHAPQALDHLKREDVAVFLLRPVPPGLADDGAVATHDDAVVDLESTYFSRDPDAATEEGSAAAGHVTVCALVGDAHDRLHYPGDGGASSGELKLYRSAAGRACCLLASRPDFRFIPVVPTAFPPTGRRAPPGVPTEGAHPMACALLIAMPVRSVRGCDAHLCC